MLAIMFTAGSTSFPRWGYPPYTTREEYTFFFAEKHESQNRYDEHFLSKIAVNVSYVYLQQMGRKYWESRRYV